MTPQFDDSLEALASSAGQLVSWGGWLVAIAVAAYVAIDRTSRPRWQTVALRVGRAGGGYRAARFVEAYMDRAPALVRAAALGCFAFATVFVPGLVFALTTFRFDGIGVALIPGVGIACVTGFCGWLLLRRSALAPEIVRGVALMSLTLNVALFGLSVLHLTVVEAHWGGPLHECSAAVAFASFLFAGVAVLQAVLMLVAVRQHAPAFAASRASASFIAE